MILFQAEVLLFIKVILVPQLSPLGGFAVAILKELAPLSELLPAACVWDMQLLQMRDCS